MNNLSVLAASALAAVFVSNMVLTRFLGLCPVYAGVKSIREAANLGAAITLGIVLVSTLTWILDAAVIIRFEAAYLRPVLYVCVALLVLHPLEALCRKWLPMIPDVPGIFGTFYCAVLGIAFVNSGANPLTGKLFTFKESLVHSCASGVGLCLVLIIMTGITKRLALARVPRPFRGMPVALLSTGLAALAFYGFAGFSTGRP